MTWLNTVIKSCSNIFILRKEVFHMAEVVYTKNAPDAIGPYSQAIKPATGNVEADTIEGQTEQVMQNLKNLLEASGSSLEKAVKTVCFLADMNDFAAFNAIYGKYFTGKPARSCVAVKTLPKNVLCEVEVIAEY